MQYDNKRENIYIDILKLILEVYVKACLYIGVILIAVIVFIVYFKEPDMEQDITEKQVIITKDDFMELIPNAVPKEYHTLLYETALYESNLTLNSKQIGGEALGIMQVEPDTEKDLYQNFIKYRKELKEYTEGLISSYPDIKNHLQYNTPYNIYMGFLVYYRNLYNKKVDLSNKWTRAWIYKKYYNTHKGKGTTHGYYFGRE